MYSSLVERTDQPFPYPEVESSRPLILEEPERVREPELSPARILLHSVLLVITVLTVVMTGAGLTVAGRMDDSTLGGFLFGAPLMMLRELVSGNFAPLINGALFAFTLLVALGSHELGHYFACRYYGIRATLPFFIPAPPYPLTPFGTLGAVIKIKAPIRTRRALFDIGIAGPLAGFVFALPASVIGLVFAKAVLPDMSGGVQFHDPLLFILISKIAGVPKWIEWNPVYWGAWGTLMVTALNLFPVGQLDGGHILYAVAGPAAHKWVSRATSMAVGTLAVVSILLYKSPVWLLWTVVLLFLTRAGHPPVTQNEPLGRARIILAAVAALVFILSFMPFPVTID